jgi:hypothetical protein
MLGNDKHKTEEDSLRSLQRITSGEQLVAIVRKVRDCEFESCELTSQEETNYISKFLQRIQDLREAIHFGYEIGRQPQRFLELTKEIEELEKRGFLLFGKRKQAKNENDLIFDVASIFIVRQNKNAIIEETNFLCTD